MSEKEKYYPVLSKNSNDSTASLFESRKFYNEKTIPFIIGEYLELPGGELEGIDPSSPGELKRKKIPLSDIYNENAMYGLIDTEGDVIAPIENMSNFKPVGKNGRENLYLQNFISDALSDMKKYLNDQILKGCGVSPGSPVPDLVANSPFFNLEVKKAYTKKTDIDVLYNANSHIVASKFKQLSLNNSRINSSIRNFTDFTKQYIPFVKEHMIISPATKSRTMLFYNFSVFNNGITFSFSEDDPGDDENKYEKYWLDIGFFSFAKACIRFGFRIDKNIPFIIHADLASPAMQKYASKYGLYNVTDIFRGRYRKLYREDIYSLRHFFINSYNTFLVDNKFYEKNIDNYCTNLDEKFAERIPIINNQATKNLPSSKFDVSMNKEFPISFWAKLYIYYKILEVRPGFTQKQYEGIYKSTNRFLLSNMRDKAFDYINSFFNELNGVRFFESLSEENNVVKQEAAGLAALRQPDITF